MSWTVRAASTPWSVFRPTSAWNAVVHPGSARTIAARLPTVIESPTISACGSADALQQQ